ncbi:MAG: NAD-dependent epimerase/dehydratase family protein, partial [bacterium]
MNLLIPGSSGFIGTNFKNLSKFRNYQDADLLVNKPVEIDFSGVDTVLHLSALVHQMQGAPEEEYFKINTDLAYEVASLAKKNGVKHFILLSTVKVFGEETTGDTPLKEDSPCNPTDPYGKSKLQAEKKILALEGGNFVFSVIRPPLVYGPGVKGNMINLVKMVDKYKYLPLGNIHNRRTMVSVKNLIALIDKVIETRKSGVFIASDPEPVSTSELVRTIAGNFKSSKKIL